MFNVNPLEGTKLFSGSFKGFDQIDTSNSVKEVLTDATRMEQIKKEARSLIFANSATYTTAEAKAKELFKPEQKVIIQADSKRFNHLHARKVTVYQQN